MNRQDYEWLRYNTELLGYETKTYEEFIDEQDDRPLYI